MSVVVVAENDPDALDLALTDLRLEGHEVHGARDAAAGRGAGRRARSRRRRSSTTGCRRARPGSPWPSGSWSSTRGPGRHVQQLPESRAQRPRGRHRRARSSPRATSGPCAPRWPSRDRATRARAGSLLAGGGGRGARRWSSRSAILVEARDARRPRGRARRSPGRGASGPARWWRPSTSSATRPPSAPAPGTREVGLDDPDGPSAVGGRPGPRHRRSPRSTTSRAASIVIARYDPPGPTDGRRPPGEPRRLLGDAAAARRPTLDSLEPDAGSLAVLGPGRPVAASRGPPDARPTTWSRSSSPLDETVAPGWRLEALGAAQPDCHRCLAGRRSLILLGGLVAAVGDRRGGRDATEAERADAPRRQRSEATLAELASVAQSSLDLAEVLPASFAVLESALDLDGAVARSAPARRPTFVWRDAPADDEPAQPARGARARRLLRRRPAGPRRAVPGSAAGAAAPRARRAGPAHARRRPPRRCRPRSPTPTAYAHQRALITRMRALDDLKTVFVATASHELRTPVAAIIGYANMLAENWDDLDTRDRPALRPAGRQQRPAPGRPGRAPPRLLPAGAGRRLHAASQGAARPRRRGAGPDRGPARPDAGPRAAGRRGARAASSSGSQLAIERVLTNLVGNAAKYSPAGTTIRVRVEGDGAVAHLIVDDEGPGVPEARARADLQPVLPRQGRRGDPHPGGRAGPLHRDRVRLLHGRRGVDRRRARRGRPVRGDLPAATPPGTSSHVPDQGDPDDPA